MKVGELKKRLIHFDDDVDVFIKVGGDGDSKFRKAAVDMQAFNGKYYGFKLILVKEKVKKAV